MCIDIIVDSVKMHLLTLWPWPLNTETTSSLAYPNVISYTKFEQWGRLFLSYAVDKLTNKQTEPNMLLVVGKKYSSAILRVKEMLIEK